MRTIVSGLAFAIVAGLFSAPAIAAPNVVLACPTDARGVVTHNGDAEWVATTQSSRPVLASIEQIGGQPALVCTYHMFGGDYWIYRRAPVDYPRCRRSDTSSVSFYCTIA